MLNPHHPCFFAGACFFSAVSEIPPGSGLSDLFPSAGTAAEPVGAPLFAQLSGRDHSNSIVPGSSFGRGEKSDGSICIQWLIGVRKSHLRSCKLSEDMIHWRRCGFPCLPKGRGNSGKVRSLISGPFPCCKIRGNLQRNIFTAPESGQSSREKQKAEAINQSTGKRIATSWKNTNSGAVGTAKKYSKKKEFLKFLLRTEEST